MTSLMMLVQRSAPFGSVEEAREPLAALARELGAASLLGSMWTRFQGVVLPLDPETIELLLTEGRSVRAGRPGQPTHVIPINGLPAGPCEVGLISLTVRPAADPPAKQPTSAGLRLTLRISDTSFRSDADTLLCLLGGCFDTALADTGALGPRAWVKEMGTGWATATRRTGRDWLPSGATIVPGRTGSIVIAHREDPASASPSARDAVLRVHETLNGAPVRASVPVPRTAPVPAPREEHVPLPPVQLPSYSPPLSTANPVAPLPLPPALRPASDLSCTIAASSLPIPERPPADPLPFGNTRSAEFVASLSAIGPTTPHSEVGETLPLGANLLASIRPTLPFDSLASVPGPPRAKHAKVAETLPLGANLLSALLPTLPFKQLAGAHAAGVAPPTPLPDLTLDAYASLCAELTVFPAKSAEILRKYGLADDRARRGMDQRWQDLFTTAPSLRSEWQRKTTAFCDWLRHNGR